MDPSKFKNVHKCPRLQHPNFTLQRSAKRLVRGCEKFVPALAYLFCLTLPGSCLARFAYLLADLCKSTGLWKPFRLKVGCCNLPLSCIFLESPGSLGYCYVFGFRISWGSLPYEKLKHGVGFILNYLSPFHRYVDGYISENVEVTQPKNAVPATFTICPSFDGSYRESTLQVFRNIIL